MSRLLSVALAAVFLLFPIGRSAAANLTPLEELGKKLFFDKNLSTPSGQSCAGCHDPDNGWTGPTENAGGVYEGAVKGRFGNRKPPSSAYAGDSPVLHLEKEENFVGGMFWDGRATGAQWKDPLAEQAGGPFLNPLEQNNPDKKAVVLKVRKSDYASLFERVWKLRAADWDQNADKVYEDIARSIAAYERSDEVNPFNSKFDSFWRKAKAKNLKVEAIDATRSGDYANLGLDDTELKGLLLFNTKARCAECHSLAPGPSNQPPVFTDYTYDNDGVPKNPANPFYTMDKKFNPEGTNWIDPGLGGFLKTAPQYARYAERSMGKHKVPTLRNVDLRRDPGFVKVYMHNGALKSLEEVVHFYNTRDAGQFPPPELKANLNTEQLGKLGLTHEEENAVVAFLKTLSDHYAPAGN
jgi:cytochrome c peroxidase